MTHQPCAAAIYKRVKYLTNIGEHAEANALFRDLQARSLIGINQSVDFRRKVLCLTQKLLPI